MQKLNQSKPDFIVIGAMKSATSAIYEYLTQHPLVIRRMPKELHFFTLRYEKGLDWYLSQFKRKQNNANGDKLLIGEASPSYFPSPVAPERIYQLFPQVKIILSLRNPTDRAISHYYHQLNRVKDETRPIELAFSNRELAELEILPHTKTKSYIQVGEYLSKVIRWLDVFPQEQILILNYHDLETDSNAFANRIFKFLDLPEHQINNTNKIYANQYPAIPAEIRARIDKHFQTHNHELSNFLDINFNFKQVKVRI